MPSKRANSKMSIRAEMVELASELDLARNACTFDSSIAPIFAFKEEDKYVLFATGEKVGNTTEVYYIKRDSIAKYCTYYPGSESQSEEVKFVDEVNDQSGYKSFKIPVIEVLNLPLKKGATSQRDIITVHIKDPESIITGLVNKSIEDSIMEKVYVLGFNGEKFIGSFNLLGNEDNAIFAYSKINHSNEFSFFRYSYTKGVTETSSSLIENPYIYIRAINLSGNFKFFLPE
ncbi:MAG: hypothetical protein LVQ97_03405 [Candidatus Micrarchaeales archaeon]|uniref:Uncharacterized protein n=1 Tax=Candidatus Micrarchaeum acidiphilum ARMAN-2 TaxID=425595 RepID=C7DGP1_MICA2|nr:MAG: hypothetical protein UNLARM2_0242 [Candidatus Micrarchaeum acidiphilum ARMAN-2]MCW6161205.1 hypothetical protein [Candidatus Micrarchaeales archaeon]